MATTASLLADQLRADIDTGVWKPGAALRQEELATRYGASRIPVREALQLLQAEGLVVIAPNRGASVASLTRTEVEEIFDLRGMLEADLLARAVPHHDRKTLVRLESIQEELEVEDSRAGWLTGDRRFHEALYRPAGRARTFNLMLMLRRQVERYALSQVEPGTRRDEWKREHRAVIAAVRAKDVDRAVLRLTEHLNETRAVVLGQLESPAFDKESA
jgi:DNA-binding GntR family transcriptional regulator